MKYPQTDCIGFIACLGVLRTFIEIIDSGNPENEDFAGLTLVTSVSNNSLF